MARYIDADAVISHMDARYNDLLDEYGRADHYASGYEEAIDLIEEAPTADVAEVKHGEWRQVRCGDTPLYACSECGKNEYMQLRYCPNCGAKMDGGNDHGKEKQTSEDL